MRIATGAIRQRIGHRGAALLWFALLDVIYAWSLASPPRSAATNPTLVFLREVMPLGAWAALWGAVGALCFVCAFRRSDKPAFGAAAALKVLWGCTLLGGWMAGQVERGWVSAAIWLPLAAFVYLISTWPEPIDDGSRSR